MALKDYESKKLKRLDNRLDIVASDKQEDDSVFVRVVTKPRLKSGWIGVDTADRMVAALEDNEYDLGVLIGERFTKAARQKLRGKGIHFLSNRSKPTFKLDKLFFVAEDLANKLCKAECGFVPQKKTDCKGYVNGRYSCKTRLISDNASFHFERGWKRLLQQDVLALLAIRHSIQLTDVKGIGPKWAKVLRENEIGAVRELASQSPEDLAEKIGVSKKLATKWVANAKELLSTSEL